MRQRRLCGCLSDTFGGILAANSGTSVAPVTDTSTANGADYAGLESEEFVGASLKSFKPKKFKFTTILSLSVYTSP